MEEDLEEIGVEDGEWGLLLRKRGRERGVIESDVAVRESISWFESFSWMDVFLSSSVLFPIPKLPDTGKVTIPCGLTVSGLTISQIILLKKWNHCWAYCGTHLGLRLWGSKDLRGLLPTHKDTPSSFKFSSILGFDVFYFVFFWIYYYYFLAHNNGGSHLDECKTTWYTGDIERTPMILYTKSV